MISQRCPKCNSSRIRAGYRPTPLWSKLLFRYNLLCNNCNWEFRGFAVPGTVSAKPKRSGKKSSETSFSVNSDNEKLTDEKNYQASDNQQRRIKTKVKIRL